MDGPPGSDAQTAPSPRLRARIEIDNPGGWLQLGLPRTIEWVRAELPIPGLRPELGGLRIIHLSDLHLRDRWASGYDELIERIGARPPDLICFTGDFVEDKRDHRPALPVLKRLVSALPSRLGIYAILGNHDGDLLGPRLAEMNIHHIGGQRACLGAIELLGFPGVDRADLDEVFLMNLPPRPPGGVRIALCHYPDLFDRIARCQPDLYLCGHSHGGQVCLPGGQPLLTHDASPRHYSRGIHRRGSTWHIANRGVGAGTPAVRLFCPAEAIEITLQPA